MLRASLLQATFCLLIATAQAQADFYRYSGEDGVEVFTNTPTSRGAVRVLREGKPKRAQKERKFAPKAHLDAPSSFENSRGEENPLPVNGRISSHYGWRHDPVDGGLRHHNGVDIAVPTGTSVKAIADGTVVESGSRGGYGNLVTIDHGGGMVSLYGHNSQLSVSAGERVKAGQTVALSGSTGRSTGPHLHFELWKNGANATQAYLENGAGIPEVAGSIRSYVHSDGSLVFTNLH